MTNKELLVHTLNFIKENPHRWEQGAMPSFQVWKPDDPSFRTCFGGWLCHFMGGKEFNWDIIEEKFGYDLTEMSAFNVNTTLAELETIVNEYPN